MPLDSRRAVALVLAFALAVGPTAPLSAQPKNPQEPQETEWPYTLKSGSVTLTVYQPQFETWDGYQATARAAVSASEGEGKAQTYGIVEVSAHTIVDKESRMVTLDKYRIVKAEFPSAPEKARGWSDALQKESTNRSKTMALDRLEAALGVVAAEKKTEGFALRNDPPRIILSDVPAILVYVDGEPAYRAVAGTPLARVINTRPLLLKDANGRHYLRLFDGWMAATGLSGPWAPLGALAGAAAAPELEKARKAAVEGRQVDLLTGQTSPDEPPPSLAKGPVPVVHVVTAACELVVTEGQPEWTPIPGTLLLYAENTTGNLFKDVSSQNTYVLASGRWFTAAEGKGEWTFVAADHLPADFAKIPEESPKENVMASVAGTPQAREAAIAAGIPQTAVVKRAEVRMTAPRFDGEPELRAIPGTSLQYAVNTATPVLMVDAHSWFAVENGVWFAASSVKGPWMVATSVPAVIYTIPPNSPLHYVTYVKIYDTAAETVVVGYTPGYQGTTVDPVTEVVVYGTGYYYTPWVGSMWVGPPVTYGFGVAVRYTPWTGWTMGYGFGWSWGAATVCVGWGWGAYPWWGPYGWGYGWGPAYYPAPYRWGGAAYGYRGGAVAWGPGGWAGTTGNIYSQWGPRSSVSRYSGGYNAWTGNAWSSRVGSSYNSRTGVATAGQRGAVQNVYTGNYATGGRGVATGPGGTVAAGRGGTVGNAYTGREVSGGSGVVYNPRTGQGTSVGGVRGDNGGVARVGDDVYAGRDGNVYRRTDDGWQQRSGSNWNGVDRTTASQRGLDSQSRARANGAQRTQNYNRASGTMNRSYGGARGGGGRRR